MRQQGQQRSQSKLFPLKLPKDFHGQAKEIQSPTQIYLEKLSLRQPSDPPSRKVSNWQRKVLDRDVMRERRDFIVHPARISCDNPPWLLSTSHYYLRSQPSRPRRETALERRIYDVFGNRKANLSQLRDSMSETRVRRGQGRFFGEVTSKVGEKLVSLYKSRQSRCDQVGGKIGVGVRVVEGVRRPLLKVGSSREDNFVNTYSVT